jgi:hypothetical protein
MTASRLRNCLCAAAMIALHGPDLQAASPPAEFVTKLARHADAFARLAPRLTATETLMQRSYALPPHAHFAVGAAAEQLRASFQYHEIVSDYAFGALRGNENGALVELRELLSKDGAESETPAAARKAMLAMGGDPDQTRKKMLAYFTKLGLVDVATDFGQILLSFTTRGAQDIALEEAGEAWVGTEEALVWKWRQTSGGALEFRGRKTARRPMNGLLWVRKSDGAPLRIHAAMEHDEAKHRLRDEASVEYVLSALGSPTPVSVVHRHFVDDELLTENLYVYDGFRLFTTDTRIQYGGETGKR